MHHKLRKHHDENPVYDVPENLIQILTREARLNEKEAVKILRVIVSNGYFVGPVEPTNDMLEAYVRSYGQIAKNPRTAILTIAKARKRWQAMGRAGNIIALSRFRNLHRKKENDPGSNQAGNPDTAGPENETGQGCLSGRA